MANPWDDDPIVSSAPAAPWANDPVTKPAETAPVVPTTARGVARAVAGGATDAAGNFANILSDPFGNLIGKPLATAGVFAHDALAPVFGYQRFPDNIRNGLLGNERPQIGTGAIEGVGRAIGADPNAEPASPTENLVRKVVGGAGSVAALGPAGVAAPVMGAVGAATGDLAARAAPEWAKPAAELAGNVTGAGAVTGAMRAISPVRSALSPEGAGLVEAAQREGIPLSAGEQTGGRVVKKAEQVLAQLPGSAGGEARFAETQGRAFNRAVLSRAGVDADIATPEVLNPARARIGGEIGDIANRNTLQVTPELTARLAAAEDSLRFLPAEAAGPVRARIEQIRGMMIEAPAPPPGTVTAPGTTPAVPTIPGASYRMMDSQLGRSIRATANGDLRAALTDIRETLRGAMDDSISPADAAAWQQARRQYANLMVIADAASGAGAKAAEGHISPLNLRTALNRSTGGGYKWGQGDLNELARVGQSVLRKPSDSGTPGGTHMANLLTGSSLMSGAAAGSFLAGVPGAAAGAAAGMALPALTGAFMRSRLGQAWLTNQLGAAFDNQAPTALAGARSTQEQRLRNRLSPQD